MLHSFFILAFLQTLFFILLILAVQLEVTLDETGFLIKPSMLNGPLVKFMYSCPCILPPIFFFYSTFLRFQFALPCRGQWRWRGWRRCGQKRPRCPGHRQRSVPGTEEWPGHGETRHAEPGWGGRPGSNLHLQVGGLFINAAYFSCLPSFFLFFSLNHMFLSTFRSS